MSKTFRSANLSSPNTSQPSDWPLAAESYRFVVPRQFIAPLAEHSLSRDLYPLGLGYYREASTHSMQRDKHGDNLIIYCVDGKGSLSINGEVSTVSAGDLVCLPKGKAHHYQADRYQPWTIYWVHFDGLLSEAFIDYIGLQPGQYCQAIGLHNRLITNFERLLELRQSSHQLGAYIHAANRLRQLLAEIALLPQIRQSGGDFDLEQIHATMQAHVHEQLDLDTLANIAKLSKFHFTKKYKRLTGSTPINHFIHLKIQHACYLLDITDKSIREISEALGYEDSYYFSRLFKKVMGISPSQYRRSREQ